MQFPQETILAMLAVLTRVEIVFAQNYQRLSVGFKEPRPPGLGGGSPGNHRLLGNGAVHCNRVQCTIPPAVCIAVRDHEISANRD